MKVKVLPGAGTIVCDGVNYLPGNAFEIADKEGKRLIEAGLVESVAGRPTGAKTGGKATGAPEGGDQDPPEGTGEPTGGEGENTGGEPK